MKQRTDKGSSNTGTIIVVVLIILFVIGIFAGAGTKDTTPGDSTKSDCELNWTIHRNDTLLGYTHADYVKECVSSSKALNTYLNDHR